MAGTLLPFFRAYQLSKDFASHSGSEILAPRENSVIVNNKYVRLVSSVLLKA